MNARFGKLIFFMFIRVSCFSQTNWYHYDWAVDKGVDKTGYCAAVLSSDLEKYKNNSFIGAYYRKFAEECVLYLYEDLSAGNIYSSFAGYEDYVKQVLKTIVKDTAVTNHITVRFYRNSEYSASISESGLLRLNIGIVSQLKNEAELAMLLGHETAHFMNQDVIKNYGSVMETKHLSKAGIWNVFIAINTIYGYYWFSRAQETEADLISGRLLRDSPYSPGSGFSIFRTMKRQEIRWEIKYGARSKKAATHPDPGDRLSRLNYFHADSLNRGKHNFIVDSMRFVGLKELCFNETVNTGLISSNLDKLITQTFSRYLLDPADEKNLAVLIECLRRKLVLGKNTQVSGQSFILDEYQTYHVEKSWNYAFLRTKNPSILDHLDKGFVDIWKEDLHRIKARDLVDTTVTEFTTNMEAYLYFKEKAKNMGSVVAQHYKYFGVLPDFRDAGAYVQANNLFRTNEYLTDNGIPATQGKDLFVVMPYEADQFAYVMRNAELANYLAANNEMKEEVKKQTGGEAVLASELDFHDQHLLRSLLGHTAYYLKPDAVSGMIKQDVDWIQVCPELYGFFKKNNIRSVYICRPQLNQKKEAKELIADFYRISLPGKGPHSLSGQRITWEIGLPPGKTYPEFDAVAGKFNKFCTSPDNK
jgi:hypothetical protein